MAFSTQNFWCSIAYTARSRRKLFINLYALCTDIFKMLRDPKVCNYDIATFVWRSVQDILRLEISVHNVFGMKVADGAQDRLDHFYCVLLGEFTQRRYSVKQFTADGKFKYQVEPEGCQVRCYAVNQGSYSLFARLEKVPAVDLLRMSLLSRNGFR